MSELRTKIATFVDTLVSHKSKTAHTGVDVSWNGTSSVPSGAIEDALFRRFKEMHQEESHSSERPQESAANGD